MIWMSKVSQALKADFKEIMKKIRRESRVTTEQV